ENARLFEQVLDSEERFRDVMGNTGDWIWEVDAEGRYTYSSPVVARILGYTVEEVLGKHYHDFFHPDDRETLRATVKEASQERTPVIDLVSRSIHQDGHTVILETTGVPMFGPDGQLLGYRGTSRDVTARVQAEEALTASERKYRTVVEHANDWIWTLDCEGNFTFFNQAAEKASGYQLKDWIGRSFAPIILPEYLPHVQQVFAGTLAGSLQSYEVRLLSQDDRILTLAVNTAPLYEGEKIVGTVSMGRDVTAQRQLEDQLRQAQKMEAIGTLAGGVAHDFNNILGGILGYASFIESQLPVGDPLRPDVETIIRSARRASDLTAQLLAFARGGRYEIRPVNLNNTVNEVVQLLSRTIDKAISIETHLADDLTAVEGDAAQLQQMLLNLCLNARDAMPAGGKLIIETSSISLDEEYTSTQLEIEAGDYVFLMVSDTGMGIDAETQAHIFEPFFTTKQELPGEKHSGLGLAMVYGIVRGHGGTIHVYSELGKGTTFKIYLPAAERPAVEKKAEKSALVGGEETILVVDDEETILAMVNRLLSNAGYTVVLAESGVEAVELYRERGHEIDLVILDMIMPEMGGRETYERLREIDPGVRVLLSSGYSQNGQAQEIINAGVQGFLQKPFDLSRILNKVRKALHE
ncbi:MAG: PAS domain S-box protein, partial [Chloroflexota bacterium]|nr:PAS domain S-box protein [Chloroflexota bacterium]